ncbi:MAG TPA: hypothetical protein GYA07_00380 [Verrucomicrobia bacterium]|nr:hypothetical protein [Verrucomicrobiota bacterium]HOP97798.1 hypothetical protein [Verrucomicrobiota bacterium]
MMALLWRAEYAETNPEGRPVPPSVVWEKVLSSPDRSSLLVFDGDRRMGLCEWVTGAGRALERLDAESVPPSPEVEEGYSIRVEASVLIEQFTNRLQLDALLRLSPDRRWRLLDLNIGLREAHCRLLADASQEQVSVTMQSDGARVERALPFETLRNPAALAAELIGPIARDAVAALKMPSASQQDLLASTIRWETREGQLRFGHAEIRAYIARLRLLEYELVAHISQAGEILQVELPGNWRLLNEQLATLESAR